MSDNMRTYKTIRDAPKHLYPNEPQGNIARRLNVLAALISGIVGGRKVNLPQIADKIPDGNKPESHIKQFYRWITNEEIDAKLYFLPFISPLLTALTQTTLFVLMGGSVVGRGCVTLDGQCGLQGKSLVDCLDRHKGKERSSEGGDSPETDRATPTHYPLWGTGSLFGRWEV